jgi:mRNA-degrading endonuclease toxin of MazEF toxin-antitoxin module
MARGDVFLVDLSPTSGREQSGRRPAIAVQTDVAGDPLVVVTPVTSTLGVLRFPFTLRVEPSRENGLTQPSVIMVFQMRALDKDCIVRKLGRLSPTDMARVDAEIWRMLKPDNTDA